MNQRDINHQGMNQRGAAFAAAACSLVGVPFRLHGRDPTHGLDCVGLVAAALRRAGRQSVTIPPYRLRNGDFARFEPVIARAGFARGEAPDRIGELILLVPSPGQFHLAIAISPARIVQAHAGLRRSVISPMPEQLDIARSYRLI